MCDSLLPRPSWFGVCSTQWTEVHATSFSKNYAPAAILWSALEPQCDGSHVCCEIKTASKVQVVWNFWELRYFSPFWQSTCISQHHCWHVQCVAYPSETKNILSIYSWDFQHLVLVMFCNECTMYAICLSPHKLPSSHSLKSWYHKNSTSSGRTQSNTNNSCPGQCHKQWCMMIKAPLSSPRMTNPYPQPPKTQT